ncbi:hypothetical protein C4D60_Mb01t30760 [Musa balbisiana]|uniref:RRM domain-containing protein n=1 Tax=Musa balbisiana TaxID=52838 RepID=A0A4S8JRY1_MUSBA|nr:hypothetical protein C4D60_Mb01t30760 [Musa balbisiana]
MAFCSKLDGLIGQGLFSLSYGTLMISHSGFGNVVEARVITDRDTGRSRGFGFMNFDNGESASNAMASMAGQVCHRLTTIGGPQGGFSGGYGSGYVKVTVVDLQNRITLKGIPAGEFEAFFDEHQDIMLAM